MSAFTPEQKAILKANEKASLEYLNAVMAKVERLTLRHGALELLILEKGLLTHDEIQDGMKRIKEQAEKMQGSEIPGTG